ncbi:hypothetical protein FACS189429_7800 [Bacteroidia bacterium]|nr:hypothetical protein FACS189429_7800 [Bacteroidia bacterium]
MNKSEFFKLFYNPFERIAGAKALLAGIGFCAVIGLVGALSGAYFDGAIDCHLGAKGDFVRSFAFLAIDWASLAAVFGAAALIFAKNARLIDICGTMALAQAPRLFDALSAFFAPNLAVDETLPLNELAGELLQQIAQPAFIVFIIVSIVATACHIALIYNAFRISTNLKVPKIIVIFIAGILLAEVLSKVLIGVIF